MAFDWTTKDWAAETARMLRKSVDATRLQAITNEIAALSAAAGRSFVSEDWSAPEEVTAGPSWTRDDVIRFEGGFAQAATEFARVDRELGLRALSTDLAPFKNEQEIISLIGIHAPSPNLAPYQDEDEVRAIILGYEYQTADQVRALIAVDGTPGQDGEPLDLDGYLTTMAAEGIYLTIANARDQYLSVTATTFGNGDNVTTVRGSQIMVGLGDAEAATLEGYIGTVTDALYYTRTHIDATFYTQTHITENYHTKAVTYTRTEQDDRYLQANGTQWVDRAWHPLNGTQGSIGSSALRWASGWFTDMNAFHLIFNTATSIAQNGFVAVRTVKAPSGGQLALENVATINNVALSEYRNAEAGNEGSGLPAWLTAISNVLRPADGLDNTVDLGTGDLRYRNIFGYTARVTSIGTYDASNPIMHIVGSVQFDGTSDGANTVNMNRDNMEYTNVPWIEHDATVLSEAITAIGGVTLAEVLTTATRSITLTHINGRAISHYESGVSNWTDLPAVVNRDLLPTNGDHQLGGQDNWWVQGHITTLFSNTLRVNSIGRDTNLNNPISLLSDLRPGDDDSGDLLQLDFGKPSRRFANTYSVNFDITGVLRFTGDNAGINWTNYASRGGTEPWTQVGYLTEVVIPAALTGIDTINGVDPSTWISGIPAALTGIDTINGIDPSDWIRGIPAALTGITSINGAVVAITETDVSFSLPVNFGSGIEAENEQSALDVGRVGTAGVNIGHQSVANNVYGATTFHQDATFSQDLTVTGGITTGTLNGADATTILTTAVQALANLNSIGTSGTPIVTNADLKGPDTGTKPRIDLATLRTKNGMVAIFEHTGAINGTISTTYTIDGETQTVAEIEAIPGVRAVVFRTGTQSSEDEDEFYWQSEIHWLSVNADGNTDWSDFRGMHFREVTNTASGGVAFASLDGGNMEFAWSFKSQQLRLQHGSLGDGNKVEICLIF